MQAAPASAAPTTTATIVAERLSILTLRGMAAIVAQTAAGTAFRDAFPGGRGGSLAYPGSSSKTPPARFFRTLSPGKHRPFMAT